MSNLNILIILIVFFLNIYNIVGDGHVLREPEIRQKSLSNPAYKRFLLARAT